MASTGQSLIDVQVLSPSGRVIEQQTIVVRATGYNRVALLITIGAAILLFRHGPGSPVGPRDPGPSDRRPRGLDARGFVRNTVVMSIGTALSRLTSFLRLSAMAFALGITESRLPDAYNIANVTPNILYELALGGILTSVVVPVVVEWMQTRGRDAAWDVVRRLFTLAFVACPASRSPASSWHRGSSTSTRRASRVPTAGGRRHGHVLPAVVHAADRVLRARRRGHGLLNAHRRFAPPMFAPILSNLVVIGTFLLFAAMPRPPDGSNEVATDAQRLVLAIGTTLGVVAMTVVLWPFVGGPASASGGWRAAATRRSERSCGSRRGCSSTWSRTRSATSS